MELRPSEIRYSQDSICSYFDSRGNHANIRIGQTLDAICEGRCDIDDMPAISVMNVGGQWMTADNRRLWVLKHLERLGKCSKVPVYQTYRINPQKLTSTNGGQSVEVRGRPGGRWYMEPASNRYHSASTRPTPKPTQYIGTSYSPPRHDYRPYSHSVPTRVEPVASYRPQSYQPYTDDTHRNREDEPNIFVRFVRWLLGK